MTQKICLSHTLSKDSNLVVIAALRSPAFVSLSVPQTIATMSKDPEAQMTATILEREPLIMKENLDNDADASSSVWADAMDTVTLGFPIFLSMLSWVGMKTTDSALLGHVSGDALAAAALSDLVRGWGLWLWLYALCVCLMVR